MKSGKGMRRRCDERYREMAGTSEPFLNGMQTLYGSKYKAEDQAEVSGAAPSHQPGVGNAGNVGSRCAILDQLRQPHGRLSIGRDGQHLQMNQPASDGDCAATADDETADDSDAPKTAPRTGGSTVRRRTCCISLAPALMLLHRPDVRSGQCPTSRRS